MARDALAHLTGLQHVGLLALVEPLAPYSLRSRFTSLGFAAIEMHLPVF